MRSFIWPVRRRLTPLCVPSRYLCAIFLSIHASCDSLKRHQTIPGSTDDRRIDYNLEAHGDHQQADLRGPEKSHVHQADVRPRLSRFHPAQISDRSMRFSRRVGKPGVPTDSGDEPLLPSMEVPHRFRLFYPSCDRLGLAYRCYGK